MLRIQGARIGKQTKLSSPISVNWPNQISVGHHSIVQNGVSFEYCHGVMKPGPNIQIGNNTFIGRYCEFNITEAVHIGDHCLIASGCKFIDHDHGMQLGKPMSMQAGATARIAVEDDVWIGVNAVILKGVTVGRGAVVAAGAIVNRSIPTLEIWGGVPAKRIGTRLRSREPADGAG